ncbi:MAG TPA: HD-GYP domain-containing protein [Solirubrobacteraceae bacterium]|jgi:HD-GYP domain-containing protein (c-di-GMP phosphodiesterase class II)
MQIDSYDSPDAQSLLLAGEQRTARRRPSRRELTTNCVGAVAFIGAASLLAALSHWAQPLRVVNLVLVLAVWLMVERIRFPVASCWTYPTMLVFVPALFMLPTPIVPFVAVVAIVLRAAPQLARREVGLEMLPAFVGDAWFTFGPALVIVLAGAQIFSWSHWPVYVLAFVAQVAFDLAANVAWSWIGEGINPRVQVPLLGWIYAVDAALAPLGLLIAAVTAERPGLLVIALSPTVMLIAFARERQQRLDQTVALSAAYRGTALLLGDVVEADDEYTGLHSRDVLALSLAVAESLGLDPSRRRNVEFSALLHDVGKIRVPKEIVNKTGQLDDEEWAIIRRHTIEGEAMLEQVGGILASVGRFVRCSHERFDGFGYPDGLHGEEIPIESRIVSACDAFSAMTTNRPYRSAMNVAEAIDELRRCSGSQFDPEVIEVLCSIVAERAGGGAEPVLVGT